MGWAVRFVCLSLALSPGPSTVSAHSKCSLLAGEWTLFTSSPGPLPWTHQAPPCPSAPWCHPQLAPTPSLLRSAPVLHPVGVSPPPLFLIMPICQRHNQVPPPGSLPSPFLSTLTSPFSGFLCTCNSGQRWWLWLSPITGGTKSQMRNSLDRNCFYLFPKPCDSPRKRGRGEGQGPLQRDGSSDGKTPKGIPSSPEDKSVRCMRSAPGKQSAVVPGVAIAADTEPSPWESLQARRRGPAWWGAGTWATLAFQVMW